MAFKIFLDANILLDFLLQRKVGYTDAKVLIKLGIDSEIALYTSPAVLHIVSYYVRQVYGSSTCKKLLSALLSDVVVVDCDHATALIAINSNMDDVEDALQYYTALKENLDYFISSDKKLKKAAISILPVYTANEILKILNLTN